MTTENTTASKTEDNASSESTFNAPKGFIRYRRLLIVLAHIVAFWIAMLLAFLFAFNMQLLRKWVFFQFPIIFFIALPIKLIIFAWFKQYSGWWRYVGLNDLISIAKASLVSTIILIVLWYGYGLFGDKIIPESSIDDLSQQMKQIQADKQNVVSAEEVRQLDAKHENLKGLRNFLEVSRIIQIQKQVQELPVNSQQREQLLAHHEELRYTQRLIEGVIMLDMFTTIMILAAFRMLIRLYHEEFFSETRGTVRRFLIIGAGNAGEALLREMLRRTDVNYDVIGFVDDDPAKQGMSIHGIPVLGHIDQIPEVCTKKEIDEIAIAIPSASRQQLRHVVQLCQGTQLRFSTVPSLTDIASGKLKVSQMRDVDINDLLGRDVVRLDLQQIEAFLKDKVIAVTGAGGSIGSEMCRQVCAFEPKHLLLIEQAENPLFFIEGELRRNFPDVKMTAVICDIAEQKRVDQIFDWHKPEVVIHAAAHKHVPLMEGNPGEAIKNNVVGTRNIANAADKHGADDFVMISTDKAVNPTSIMGSSKRIAEMYIQDLNNTSKTHFVTVRFGNVLGSNGSVVPIFKKQINSGGPVTVTHPDMTRYFMTIPEASQLVLQAAT
ncbi:MAG: polysaccharide biosynthesis protein, partial [Planctomycetota bacterium]